MAQRKVGRPEWIPEGDILDQAKYLSSRGLTQEQIADCLGIGLSTLCDKKNKFPEFAEVIKKGKSLGIGEISNTLFESAKAGNVPSMIFYLKSQGGWKDGNIEAEVKKSISELFVNRDKNKDSQEENK